MSLSPGNAKDTTVASNYSHVELSAAKYASPPTRERSEMEIEDGEVITSDDVQKYSKDDDEAMKAMVNYDGPPLILDEATNRRLLRKIDWHLMPVL